MAMAKPEIRKLLVLSTAHVPAGTLDPVRLRLEGAVPAVDLYPTRWGAIMWVPDDPQESSDGDGNGPVPDVFLKIQKFARKHHCDYVLLDRDGPVESQLEVFEW